MMYKLTPHLFKCHTPIKEIKLIATIKPNKAGYQSPSFFTEGENTAGKLNTIQINPNIQTSDSNFGRFLMMMDSIVYELRNFTNLRIKKTSPDYPPSIAPPFSSTQSTLKGDYIF